MAVKLRGGGNSSLLNMSYSNPNIVKSLLKNMGGMEAMSLRGDRVATCVLADLQAVTGINISKYDRKNRKVFDAGWKAGVLTYLQYMCVAYVLVLGYNRAELAYILGVQMSTVRRHIDSGVKKICFALESGWRCEDCDKKDARGR